MIIIILMKRAQPVDWSQIISQVDRMISKKHALSNVTAGAEKILHKYYKNTKVFVVLSDTIDEPTGIYRAKGTRSFVIDFASLVAKKKKTVVVNTNLTGFCKKHGITPAQRSIRSVLGAAMQYQNRVYGVLILEHVKETNAFGQKEEKIISMIAYRLATEAAYALLVEENCRLEQEKKELSLIDPLTQMPNRNFCDLVLDMEFRKAKGYTRQLSLAVVAPDNYRSINSKYGTEVGNALLVHVAATLKKNVRDTDFVGRFRGEEFMVLLPEALNEAAVNAADRVRNAFEDASFVVKRLGRKKVTISIGVVTYPTSAESLPTLLEQADKALKRAKQVGRNQVVAL